MVSFEELPDVFNSVRARRDTKIHGKCKNRDEHASNNAQGIIKKTCDGEYSANPQHGNGIHYLWLNPVIYNICDVFAVPTSQALFLDKCPDAFFHFASSLLYRANNFLYMRINLLYHNIFF